MAITLRNAMDVTVNVKPVYLNLVHSAVYEGPCRVGTTETLSPEADKKRGWKAFNEFTEEIKSKITGPVRILEPVFLQWGDDFVLHGSEFKKLEADIYEADLVLMTGGLLQYPAVRIAEMYGRPVGQIGWVTSVDITANLRSRGMEGYAFLDFDHLNEYIAYFHVRKAFRNMRMMIGVEGATLPSVGVVSSILDLQSLEDRYGVTNTSVTAQRFVEMMDNLSDVDVAEVDTMTRELIENAEACHMKEEDVEPSVRFFVAVKKLLEKHEANAFVIPCFEICATQVMAERRVMFCLTHSLLKSMGIPSACEADVNVLMSIALLTFLGKKSVHMGNTMAIDRENNILRVAHDVPGFKMHGFDEPDNPYELRNFTEGGWGATVRYDFARDTGTTVTLARFNPHGDKLLVATGEITGSDGFDRIGCSMGAHVKLNDLRDFFEKQMYFGHHMAMIYGDYSRALHYLGEIMGFEVVSS
jgi:L-fucose isomerase-like protein